MKNNHGRTSGLALLLLLAAALLVIWLIQKQMAGLSDKGGEDGLRRVQEVVQSISERTQNAAQKKQESQWQILDNTDGFDP